MVRIFIENTVCYHYEIIESIILKYHKILGSLKENITFYLSVRGNPNFIEYISIKYPEVILAVPSVFDYYISVTIYDKHYDSIHKNSNKYFYISHDVSDRLSKLTNVYFLTPLGNKYLIADRLPYIENKRLSHVPIYVIQGHINNNRRCYDLLVKILEADINYKFLIKLVGRGTMPAKLVKHNEKIILANNLSFTDFHKQFIDAYCIIPLITKQTNPQYYSHKLTSSMSYCIGYGIKCLIDKDLQDIYKLKNVEVFNNSDDIVNAFKKSLYDFYNK